MAGTALVEQAEREPFCRRTVKALARRIGDDPPLAELARARRAEPFTNLALATAVAGHTIPADALVDGISLLPTPELIATLAAHAAGDVQGALVRAVDRGGIFGWAQGVTLLAAAYRARRDEAPVDPAVVARARSLARWAPDDDTLAALLAVSELADDAQLTELLSELDADAWRPVVREVADHVARAFVGAPLDQAPEHPVVVPAAPRRSTKVGRNAPCPCGSGKKYKHCHEGREEEAGPALPESLEGVPAHRLLGLAPDAVPEARRDELLRTLISGSEVEDAARLLDAWEGHHGLRVEAIATAALTGRHDLARALVDGASEPVPLSATIKLLDRDAAIEALEAQAGAELDDGSVVTAWAALRGPLPRLGLLVARAVIADPQVHDDDAAWLVDELMYTRDQLGLPPFDRAEGWLARPEAGPQDSLRAELEATRQRLEQTEARKRSTDAAFRRLERERARLESEAARARGPVVVERSADEVALDELRDAHKRLKAAHKEVHDERNVLRREVIALQEALEEAEQRGADADDERADADDDDGVELSDAEVRSGQRLPRFPDGFLERLGAMPPATGATALQRVGELCGGRAVGWRDVKALQGFDNVWRVRIGRSYRLLFRVHEDELEILDLVHRQDLEKKLHQLKAFR